MAMLIEPSRALSTINSHIYGIVTATKLERHSFEFGFR